ncbi:MAG: Gldg family protein [Bacteroidota bacterium]
MKLTKSTLNIRTLLYIGIFLIVNLIAYRAFFRIDFTADKRYTLSNSSKDILKNLADQVTISAYFSPNLPPDFENVKNDFQDMLSEFASYSDGQVVYEFLEVPQEDAEKAKLQQSGLAQVQIQSRENDEIKVVNGFMGAIVKLGAQQEPIPLIRDVRGMEYSLASSVKKLAVKDKPKVGFIQGHGEPSIQQMPQVAQMLQVSYIGDTVNLSQPNSWAAFKTLVILKPQQPYSPQELAQLDEFLASGGNLFVGLDAVQANLQGQGPWGPLNTGLETWLGEKGVRVEQSFLVDQQGIQIGVQTPQMTPFGQMNVTSYIDFPYIMQINNFEDHPITEGLEVMLMQFPSPVSLSLDSTLKGGNLVYSSQLTGKQPAPVFFNPNKQWTQNDFTAGPQPMAVWVEGSEANKDSRIVVAGDGDFPIYQQGQQFIPDNANFLVNAIDWLTDDTGLIQLRTKGVVARPLEKQLEAGERSLVKVLNFLLPILILLGFGIYRRQKRKMQTLKWKAIDYS